MSDIWAIVKQRFIKGLREGFYEFFAPGVAAVRCGKIIAHVYLEQLDRAMAEAREKASNTKRVGGRE